MSLLSKFEKEIVCIISEGKRSLFLGSFLKDRQSRCKYYKALQRLKELGIVMEYHGELIIDVSNKNYINEFKPKLYYYGNIN